MGFESPAMLWALPAVAIPLVIHFYLRGRAPTVALDALMHLVLAGGATAMRLRLIHAILLAVRVAVVAVIVLLFARPYLEVPAVVGSVEPVSFALVIDDSQSMRLAS
ncbi:MAG TPA: BatA domain-containing protein, partial [Myxococcota bacterium]|nr:BatA domain-containing protein [Myxococcota bacterium]